MAKPMAPGAFSLPIWAFVAILLLFLGCRDTSPETRNATREARQLEFERPMNSLADAWNEGDATKAADCFTADAVYTEPPDKQLYRGRAELFEFFGGEDGRAGAMTMVWHHLAFDPTSGIGFGEFSFTYGTTVHGVAVVRVEDRRIARWREYWYDSELTWEEFTASNPF